MSRLSDELLEPLSDAEHASWSAWTEYMFSKCAMNPDGTATIPAWAVQNWQRQARTPYAELTEVEKDGDRNEVRKILPLIEAVVGQVPA